MTILQPIHASATPLREVRYGDWTCWRCGHVHTGGKPNLSGLCESCRSTKNAGRDRRRFRPLPSGVPGLSQPCHAWLRDFNEDDHPITPDGELVAPGRRLCGHRDCVQDEHIEVEDE